MSQIINNSISMLSKGGKQWFQNEMDTVGKCVSFETSNTSKNVKVRDSAKGTPSIKYPIFLEASKLTKDELWSSVMKDAALGIFPRRFSFNKGLLIFRNKNKQYSEYVNTDDAHECFIATKFFLQEKGNIYSDNDEFEKNNNINKNIDKSQDEIKIWSQIKSNAQRQILISEFIRKIKNYFFLNEAQTLDLEQTINLGILAGYFDTSNIKLENSAISGIDGLIQKDDNRFFIDVGAIKIKPKKVNKKINEENELTTLMSTAGLSSDFLDKNSSMITTERIIFLKTWIKFLNGFDKKIAKISN